MCFSADPNSGQPSTCWSDSLHIRKMSNENTKLARSMATGTSRQLKLNKAKADLIPWHETLLNRLISGLFSTTWCDFGKIDIPQFFNMVWIMYLYVLHYVAKDETCCSLPPNRKERQALKKKSLTAKKYWVRSTHRKEYHGPSQQIHTSTLIQRKRIFGFLPQPRGGGVDPIRSFLCTSYREREANCLLVVVAMETGRDKRPQKWRNKMTSKD